MNIHEANDGDFMEGQSHLVIPKWFLALTAIGLSIATITFVPWAVWQTRVVMRLEVQMETMAKFNPNAIMADILNNQRDILRLSADLSKASNDRFYRREFQQWSRAMKAQNPDLSIPELLD